MGSTKLRAGQPALTRARQRNPGVNGLHRSHFTSHSLTPLCKNLCSANHSVLSKFPSSISPASVLQSIPHSRCLPLSHLWVLLPQWGLKERESLCSSFPQPRFLTLQHAFVFLPLSPSELSAKTSLPGACSSESAARAQPDLMQNSLLQTCTNLLLYYQLVNCS